MIGTTPWQMPGDPHFRRRDAAQEADSDGRNDKAGLNGDGEQHGEPQRALLDYYLGVQTLRRETQPNARCAALLVQGRRPNGAPAMEEGWLPVWEGARPGDNEELYRVYRRSDAVPATSALSQFP